MTMFVSATTADYDHVGRYTQDAVNGFGPEVIDLMLDKLQLRGGETIFDGMAGDGNLTLHLFHYCEQRGIPLPTVTVFEYSRVQCEFARAALEGYPVTVVWGDITTLESFDKNQTQPLDVGVYDRVMIKSANHELPLQTQQTLYENVYRLLKPGGMFVNLGIVFEDLRERDEFRGIARVKDSLAGLPSMVANRHFLTRPELLEAVTGAGFPEVSTATPITYTIRASIVATQYFSGAERHEKNLAFQGAQLQSVALRRSQRVIFESDDSVMSIPGEITVVSKPFVDVGGTNEIYANYQYSFVKNIRAHRELMDRVVTHIPRAATVLDVGCGLGILAERLLGKIGSYTGIDCNEAFIKDCNTAFQQESNYSFHVKDAQTPLSRDITFDCAAVINVLYHQGIRPADLLRNVVGILKPGGIIVASGPISAQSFAAIEAKMRRDLVAEGMLPRFAREFERVCAANRELLASRGNYWSVEGIAELLLVAGCSRIRVADCAAFYGQAYFVVGER